MFAGVIILAGRQAIPWVAVETAFLPAFIPATQSLKQRPVMLG
jgi:hypothetical protein